MPHADRGHHVSSNSDVNSDVEAASGASDAEHRKWHLWWHQWWRPPCPERATRGEAERETIEGTFEGIEGERAGATGADAGADVAVLICYHERNPRDEREFFDVIAP